MKRFIAIVLVFCLTISTFVYLETKAEAASNPIGAQVSDWVLDEPNHFIYAVSQTSKMLLFISTDDLQVKYKMSFDTAPTDIDLYNGKLYIPLELSKQILVIDVTEKISTPSPSPSAEPSPSPSAEPSPSPSAEPSPSPSAEPSPSPSAEPSPSPSAEPSPSPSAEPSPSPSAEPSASPSAEPSPSPSAEPSPSPSAEPSPSPSAEPSPSPSAEPSASPSAEPSPSPSAEPSPSPSAEPSPSPSAEPSPSPSAEPSPSPSAEPSPSASAEPSSSPSAEPEAVFPFAIEIINTDNYPSRTAIADNAVFYTSVPFFIYKYDLTNGQESNTTSTCVEPDIAVNEINGLLYVGQSDGFNRIYSYSLTSLTSISSMPFRSFSNNSEYPNRKVIYDGDNVYYSAASFDPQNLSRLNGCYSDEKTKICYVRGNYVLTDTAIYDRDTYLKVADLPFETETVLMDSNNTIYLFNTLGNSVTKTTLELSAVSTSGYTKTAGGASVMQGIDDWVYDENSEMIYAVSKSANALLYIDAETLSLMGEKFIGSHPTDIELYDGQLYVALYGTTRIAITGTSAADPVSLIELETIPYYIALDNGKIFCIAKDGDCDLYAYDIANNTNQKIGTRLISSNLVTDRVNHILYVGSRNGIHAPFAYSTNDYALKSQGYIESNGRISFDGTDVYFQSYRLNATELYETLGSYPSLVVNVYDEYVFCKDGIYDRDTYTLLCPLPYTDYKVIVEADGSAVYYDEITKTISKFSSFIPYADSLSISGSDSVTIPSVGTISSFYTALAKDQYGQTLTNADVTWSLEETVAGVSIDQDGVVTVESGTISGTVFMVKAVSDDSLATLSVTLSYKAQEAPSGLIPVATSTETSNDGQILNVTRDMEYRAEGDTEYMPVTGEYIYDLAPGTYYVRYAAKDGREASQDTTVVIKSLTTRDWLRSIVRDADLYIYSEHVYINDEYLRRANDVVKELLYDQAATEYDLIVAGNALIDEVWRCYLEDLLTIAENEQESEYTPERWVGLQNTIAEARAILLDRTVYFEDISLAVDKLNFVLDDLPFLDMLIELAQSYEQGSIPEKTAIRLQEDLEIALALQADPFWKIDEVNDAVLRLFTDLYAVQLDSLVVFAHQLIGIGAVNYSEAVWNELNAAYTAGLAVQSEAEPLTSELASAQNRLYIASYKAYGEYLIKYAGNLQSINVISEDWRELQTSILLLTEVILSDSVSQTDIRMAVTSLANSFKDICLSEPIGLTGIAPTTENNLDGKITGTTVLMEYRLFEGDDDAVWTAVSGPEILNLIPGTYQVRYSINEISEMPGAPATVEVHAYVEEGDVEQSLHALDVLMDEAVKYIDSSHDYVNKAYLEDAYEQAKFVMILGTAVKVEVIQLKTDALSIEIRRCQLEDLLVSCYRSDQDDYTTEQWQALMTAKRTAENVIFDRSATAEDITREIDSMTEALANNAHQDPPDNPPDDPPDDPADPTKQSLQTLTDQAAPYVSSTHQYVNKDNLSAAYSQAQAVLTDDSATETAIQTASQVLREEILRCQLEDLLVRCYRANPSDYSDAQWSALMAAKQAGENVIFNPTASVSAINTAIADVFTALVTGTPDPDPDLDPDPDPPTKQDLQTLADRAVKFVGSAHNYVNAQYMSNAYAEAQSVLNDAGATEAEILNAGKVLYEEVLRCELEDLLVRCYRSNPADYTEEHWQALMAAKKLAENVIFSRSVTTGDVLSEVSRMTDALNAAG